LTAYDEYSTASTILNPLLISTVGIPSRCFFDTF
jgi:hypothetical protein